MKLDLPARAAAGAGALAGAVFVAFAAYWVETGASVGWASPNTDGQEISTGSQAAIVIVGASAAAAVGAAVGAFAGLVVGVVSSRRSPRPHTLRLVAQLVATWTVVALPLLYVATEESRTYTRKMPGWAVQTGVVCSFIWLLVSTAQALNRSREPGPTP